MGDVRSSLFGALAVKAGLATREQVQECLQIQAVARGEGEAIPRLGELMAQKGYLSPEQVQAILRGDFAEPGRRFGELCVQMGFSTPGQVKEVLAEQEGMRASGPVRRIGSLMVKKGFLKSHHIPAVLSAQGFEIAECTKCSLSYNVDVKAPAHALKCQRCGRDLILVTGYEDIDSVETGEDIRAGAPAFEVEGEEILSVDTETGEVRESSARLPAVTEAAPARTPLPSGDDEPIFEISEADIVDAADVDDADVEEAVAVEEVPPVSEELRSPGAVAVAPDIEKALAPGKAVDVVYGEFRATKVLSHDALGTLYQAKHLESGRPAALKVIDLSHTRDRDFASGFVAETKNAAALDHPNIKRIIAAGKAHGHYYYASEFVAGKSVRQIIAASGRVSLRAATRIVRAVAEGLLHAHSMGIYHGDIRPSHILVTPEGTVLLAETGVAKRVRENIERLVHLHGVMPFYTAPEIAVPDGAADARTDIFGLGATYYHMVTGRPPFEGNSPLQIFMRMAEEEAAPAHNVLRAVPVEISEVIRRMMDPEPDARYQSMAEVISELDRAAGVLPQDGQAQAASATAELRYPQVEAMPEGILERATPARPAAAMPVGGAAAGGPARPSSTARGSGPRPAAARGKTSRAEARRPSGGRRTSRREDDGDDERRYGRPARGGGSKALGVVLFIAFVALAAVAAYLILKKRETMGPGGGVAAPPGATAPATVTEAPGQPPATVTEAPAPPGGAPPPAAAQPSALRPTIRVAGEITFTGDERELAAACPKCGQAVEVRAPQCSRCGQGLDWSGAFECPFCTPPGSGTCGICKGAPIRGQMGMEFPCPVCDGSGKCRHCGGKGKMTF